MSSVNIMVHVLQVFPTEGTALEDDFQFSVRVSSGGSVGMDVQYFLMDISNGEERALDQRQELSNDLSMQLSSGDNCVLNLHEHEHVHVPEHERIYMYTLKKIQ